MRPPAALALHPDHEIGRLEPGLQADFWFVVSIWDRAHGPMGRHRDALAQTLHARVLAWLTLADERHLGQTWVAGQARYPRDATIAPLEEHR